MNNVYNIKFVCKMRVTMCTYVHVLFHGIKRVKNVRTRVNIGRRAKRAKKK